MAGFFSPDNWYWKPFEYVADAVILSGLWILTSIPLVTAGAATTALYDCVAHCVRGGEKDVFTRYFRTFRRELVPAGISFLLWAALLFAGVTAIRKSLYILPGNNAGVMTVSAMLFILSVVAGIASWVLPMLSRFTFTLGGLNIMAVKMAIAHPFRTILSGLLTTGAVFLCLRIWVPCMVVPEVLAVCWAALMEPVFKTYMTEQEREAVEKPEDPDDGPL